MRAIATTPALGEEVFDVNSEIGGTFTVSIIEEIGDGTVIVRILYGEIKEDRTCRDCQAIVLHLPSEIKETKNSNWQTYDRHNVGRE